MPELDEILATLAAQRAELIRLRDEVLARRSGARGDEPGGETAGADRRRRDRGRRRRAAPDAPPDAGPGGPDGRGRRPDRGDGDHPARHRRWPRRLPRPRQRPAGLAVLAARRGGRRLLAPDRHRVQQSPAAQRAGRDGRAADRRRLGRAREGLPTAAGRRAGRRSPGRARRLRPGRLLRGARAPRAGLDGHRRSRRAGVPPGSHQARRGLRPRRPRQPGGHRQEPDRRPGLAGRGRRSPNLAGPGIDLAVLIADIDRRLADLAAHPTGATLGPPVLHRSEP